MGTSSLFDWMMTDGLLGWLVCIDGSCRMAQMKIGVAEIGIVALSGSKRLGLELFPGVPPLALTPHSSYRRGRHT